MKKFGGDSVQNQSLYSFIVLKSKGRNGQTSLWKTYYHCYYYKYFGQGFDVYDDTRDQHYVKDSEYYRSTDAINDIGGIGIMNSAGSLFEAQHNKDATAQGGGQLGQDYACDLAEYNNYDWFDICDFFYSSSDKSSGDIKQFEYDMTGRYAF